MVGARKSKRKGKISTKANSSLFVLTAISYPLILFLVFWGGTNVESILLAFQKTNVDGTVYWVGLDNFKTFFRQTFTAGNQMFYSFRNSILNQIISFVICVPLYIAFSYQIYRKCFLHETIRAVSMLPSIISGYVISLIFINFIDAGGPLNDLMDKTGQKWFPLLYPTTAGKSPWIAVFTGILYCIWLSFSTSLLIYPNAMNAIPPEIRDSAKIDGVDNAFSDLRYIVLPLIFPTMETFILTGLSGMFMNAGPLIEFYYLSAPDYASYVGYYYQVQVLRGNTSYYPVLAAGGLVLTAFTAPIVFAAKWLMDRFGPTTDQGGNR